MLGLDSFRLPLTGWTLDQKGDRLAVWSNEQHDVLALNYFPERPDIPDPRQGPEPLRQFFRPRAAARQASIVDVDVVSFQAIACARLLLKARQPDSLGMTYQGTLIVPRRDFSFVIRVYCQEIGVPGMREAGVLASVVPKPESEEALFELADQEKFDDLFPNHPLSRVRRVLAEILQKTNLSDEILFAPLFEGPAGLPAAGGAGSAGITPDKTR